MNRPYLEIHWEDPKLETQASFGGPFKAYQWVSRGWLVHEDDKLVVLAHSYEAERQAEGDYILILKSLVTKRRRLRI